MSSNNYAYLGKAVAYPIRVQTGSVKLAEGVEMLEGSIRMILMTPVGSRELVPTYGSRLNELLWEPNDTILETLLRVYIIDAIDKNEPRIRLQSVSVVSKDDMSLCRLKYKILSTDEVKEYIFPFSRKLPY